MRMLLRNSTSVEKLLACFKKEQAKLDGKAVGCPVAVPRSTTEGRLEETLKRLEDDLTNKKIDIFDFIESLREWFDERRPSF